MKKRRNVLWICLLTVALVILSCRSSSNGGEEEVTPEPVATLAVDLPLEGSAKVKLTLVTGEDGTNDNPIFGLSDTNMTPVFSIDLDKPGDLQPNQTDVYEFDIPYPYCRIIAWQLTKPASKSADDPWLLNEMYIEIDGVLVMFMRDLSSSFGLTTSASAPYSGNWSGVQAYTQICDQ
jgi:hypothetical protein